MCSWCVLGGHHLRGLRQNGSRSSQSLPSSRREPAIALRGPLSIASTLTENFLLEYTEGMAASNVGWGCVNGANLGSLLELHNAAADFSQRPETIARVQAANLLHEIAFSFSQATGNKPVAGALSRVSDRALFLIGHDTNIASIAGLLNLHWIADGRSDDTSPDGALVFELWRAASGEDSVRVYCNDADPRTDAVGDCALDGKPARPGAGFCSRMQPR